MAAPMIRLPPLTVVDPVQPAAPLRVRLPAPDLVKLPTPLLPMALLKTTSKPLVSNTAPPGPKVMDLADGSKAVPSGSHLSTPP